MNNAAKVEMQKLHKAKAAYKAKTKDIQKRIANKLFAPTTLAAAAPKAEDNHSLHDENPISVHSSEQANANGQVISSSNKNEQEEHIKSDQKTDITTSKPSTANLSMIYLFVTSLLVILFSIFFAFKYRS